jgi:hypothetical protein
MLQALHKGPAVRQYLHQHEGQVQEPAGVRMLESIDACPYLTMIADCI